MYHNMQPTAPKAGIFWSQGRASNPSAVLSSAAFWTCRSGANADSHHHHTCGSSRAHFRLANLSNLNKREARAPLASVSFADENAIGSMNKEIRMAASPQPQVKKRAVKQSGWKALTAHYKAVSKLHLRQLFADDPKRGQRMAVEAVGLYLDYSKNRVTDETLKLLLQLAVECDLRARIDAMFSGDKINVTEKRAVLHVALRAPKNESIVVEGKDVVPEVHTVLDRMTNFSNRVRSGEWKGHTG